VWFESSTSDHQFLEEFCLPMGIVEKNSDKYRITALFIEHFTYS
jgi:hypothetical protein